MEIFNTETFETESHSEDLDFIYNQDFNDIESVVFHNRDIKHDLKAYFRFVRKYFSLFIREKMQKNFTNIVFLTLDCPPFTFQSSRIDSPIDFISKIRNQYPDKDIRVLIPIIGVDEDFRTSKKLTVEINGDTRVLEKTSIVFDFFLQNRPQEAVLYKYPKFVDNVQVYGIYCPSFSRITNISDFTRLQVLAPFMKASRIAIKKMNKIGFTPDIVHSENLPFFLGEEFEVKLPYQIRVLQAVKDFTLWDVAKTEAFWCAINLADKKSMKKICRDEVIKKCIARLFNLHNDKRFYQMKDCLRFIYKNYYKFRKFVDKGDDVEENLIFNRLNARITQLFPQMAQEDKLYFNPMISSIRRADFWITISKSYYKNLFENPKLAGGIFKYIEKTKEKSNYISFGLNTEKYNLEQTRQVYNNYNIENFREERKKNKSILLKEFSIDRIKTSFIDPTLFKSENIKIVGNLDSFYDAPIFFANPSSEIFAQGVDVLFNTIIKLFELHKNVQFIICIKDGLKNGFVSNWIDFLSSNKYFNGKWVFVDGEIDLPKILAGVDMYLLPRRTNISTPEHFIAMRYGCVPIASRLGIMNDTIADIFEDISNGCGFKTKIPLMTEEDNNEIFMTPVLKALNLYQNNPSSWNLLIKNCMNYDSSWNFKILEKYGKIYDELL